MPFRPGYYPSADPARAIREAGDQAMRAYFAYKQDQRLGERHKVDMEARNLRNALQMVELESDPRFTFEAPPAREYVGPSYRPEDMIPDRPLAPGRMSTDAVSPFAMETGYGGGMRSPTLPQGMAADPTLPGSELPSAVLDVLPPGMPGSYGVGLGDVLKDVGPLFAQPEMAVEPKPQVLPGQMVPGMGYSPVAIYPDPPARPPAGPDFRSNEELTPIATVGGRNLYRAREAEGAGSPSRQALIEAARRGDARAQARLLADPNVSSARYRQIMAGYEPAQGPDMESVRMMELYRRMIAGEEGAEQAFSVMYPSEYRSYRTTLPEEEGEGFTPTATERGRARLLELYDEYQATDDPGERRRIEVEMSAINSSAARRMLGGGSDGDIDRDFIPGNDEDYARTLMFDALESEDFGGDMNALRVALEADLADPDVPEEDKQLAMLMLNALTDERNRVGRANARPSSGGSLTTDVLRRGGSGGGG